MFFSCFIALIILQRIVELGIAKKNEKWMKARGGYEVGKEHYKYIVLVHILFFVTLIIEVFLFEKQLSPLWVIFLFIFSIAQVIRVWSIMSLGRFWNTKIIVVPNTNIIEKGPYKWVRHPNYLVVLIELLVLPLIFDAFWTAIIFTILNIVVLKHRIQLEEQELMKGTNYGIIFQNRYRFVPSRNRP
ncbi:isoprenylcysteine carboxyl methyltransferase family protein [Calidifontibacillus erzurumensis]|uniref:15-methylpalmitoyl-4-hydroxy-2-pyrone 4-O-methyltransferase n=1 Tax=Calidifontibacillus erzurumensis TaxID=2741433 RepID=A0A8J8GEX9_9BACI|nr:isoprenylcysteine carboxylmethyltransferase family protein [Calidifontibacillus erzurumensis]NSL52654.1 hypothetical protein [Calidifontibacillus erzurumensis]